MTTFVSGLRLQPDGRGRFRDENNNSYGNVKIHYPQN